MTKYCKKTATTQSDLGQGDGEFESYKEKVQENRRMQQSDLAVKFQIRVVRDGNGLDLIQDPRDPNLIGSDLNRFKIDLDRIWISMCGFKTDLEQIWIYLNI